MGDFIETKAKKSPTLPGLVSPVNMSIFFIFLQVRGYPTIKMFPAGKKDQSDAQEYDGGRTASDIVAWVNDKHTANIPPPEVYQVNNNVYNSFR